MIIETTDVLFAADSIPAILAVTRDPFLVFTSNAFAIMGLCNLYFLRSGMITRFTYVKLGLAAVLAFVGAQMLLSDIYPIPIWLSRRDRSHDRDLDPRVPRANRGGRRRAAAILVARRRG